MVSGYETRQGGRQTFASATPAPQQFRPASSGASAGAQVVGGQSQGGIFGGDITTPGPIGADLGEFFGRIMEPHIQRRQNEQYLKGAVDQMGRQAGDEIRASNGGFSKIFGPTSYESGAIFYGANKAVNEFGKETMDNMDTFQRMPRDEFAKVLADKMDELQTGDRFTDQATRAAVFESLGPLVETHEKRRYVWKQKESAASQVGNLQAGAGFLQSGAVNLAALSDPTDAESSAFAQLADSFAASAIKPPDMDDDTYKTTMYNFIRGAAQQGNGYAVRTLMDRGFGNVLDEDDRQRLEDQIAKYGNKAGSEVMQTPEMVAMVRQLRVMESIGFKDSTGTFRRATATEMGEAMEAINQAARRKTGFDLDIFDWKEVDGTVKSSLAATKAAYDRAESRQWQIEDREDQQAHDDAVAGAAEAKGILAVATEYAGGGIKTALTLGIGQPKDYEALSIKDYRKGDFAPLIRNYRIDGYVSERVSNQMQHTLSQSLGGQYTDATKMAYEEWKKAYNDPRGGLAFTSAYYGKHNLPILNFDKLVSSGFPPQVAYERAFQNPAQYSAQMNPGQRAAAGKLIDRAIASEEPWKWAFTNVPIVADRRGLNAHSKRLMKEVMLDQFALTAQNTSLSPEIIAAQLNEQLGRNGRVERYGSLVIKNPVNTRPLSDLLHLKTIDADSVVMGLIDRKLKATGAASGAYGNEVVVKRILDPSDKPMLWVESFSDDPAHPSHAIVSWQELWDATQKHVAGKVAKAKPPTGRRYNGVDPYRRIPGESAAARVVRMNREVNAGADPTLRQ
jgi:hypothetical protein